MSVLTLTRPAVTLIRQERVYAESAFSDGYSDASNYGPHAYYLHCDVSETYAANYARGFRSGLRSFNKK